MISLICSNAFADTSMTAVEIPKPFRIEDEEVRMGEIKAVVVRLGFSDAPADDTNPVYKTLNDDYLKSLFDGKEGGFNLPYNGFSDYLYKSSYGKLSMEFGCAVDIQLSGVRDSYLSNDGLFYSGYNEELLSELYKKVDVSDYDYNGNKDIDALYIFDMSGDYAPIEYDRYYFRLGTVDRFLDDDLNNHSAVYMSLTNEDLKNEEMVINLLVHETGHMLFDLQDYYMLEEYSYYNRADIGNIMGITGSGDADKGDYDAFSKWAAEWITDENVVAYAMEKGDTGEISLTPYDSDTADGIKLALLKYGDGYIAVDYCGGLNNDNYDTEKRKKGFRFYKIRDSLDIGFVEVEQIYFGFDNYLAAFQRFSDGEKIDINPDGNMIIKIYDIVTGDSPSFKYMITDNKEKEDNEDKPAESIEQTDCTNETESIRDTEDPSDPTTEYTDKKTDDDTLSDSQKTQSETSVKISSYNRHVTKVTGRSAATLPPQTGDKNSWITIAGASAAVLITAVVVKRKRRAIKYFKQP